MDMITSEIINRLQRILESLRTGEDTELAEIEAAREEVFNRYQTIFSVEHIPELTAEEFKSFLFFKNNRHWKAIHRQSNLIVEDMDSLRKALRILFDESRSIEDRLRDLRPRGGEPKVKGLARSVITPILLIVYPNQYGVLNQVSESGLKELGLWPDFERRADFATRYVAINEILLTLSRKLEIDLWTLDSLWWRIEPMDSKEPLDESFGEELVGEKARFGLENHLHEFLRDNWEHTELGEEWILHEEDGELVGYKYNTGQIGEIDLLAKHKSEARWLVIELKRGRTSDNAVGQVLRYRGWVKRHLAQNEETVEGLVISHEVDPKLQYALDGVDGVNALIYSVSFALHSPPYPWKDRSL